MAWKSVQLQLTLQSDQINLVVVQKIAGKAREKSKTLAPHHRFELTSRAKNQKMMSAGLTPTQRHTADLVALAFGVSSYQATWNYAGSGPKAHFIKCLGQGPQEEHIAWYFSKNIDLVHTYQVTSGGGQRCLIGCWDLENAAFLSAWALRPNLYAPPKSQWLMVRGLFLLDVPAYQLLEHKGFELSAHEKLELMLDFRHRLAATPPPQS